MEYFCPECKAQVSDTDAICPYCCYTLRKEAPICKVEICVPKKEIPKTGIIIGIIVAAVLAIAVGVFIYFFSFRPKKIVERVEEVMQLENNTTGTDMEIKAIYYNQFKDTCFVDVLVYLDEEPVVTSVIIDFKEEKVYYQSLYESFQVLDDIFEAFSSEGNTQYDKEVADEYGYDPFIEYSVRNGSKSWNKVFEKEE